MSYLYLYCFMRAQITNALIIILTKVGRTLPRLEGEPKTTPIVSQQICAQCLLVKLVLSDLCVTHEVLHKHIIFLTIVKYSIG